MRAAGRLGPVAARRAPPYRRGSGELGRMPATGRWARATPPSTARSIHPPLRHRAGPEGPGSRAPSSISWTASPLATCFGDHRTAPRVDGRRRAIRSVGSTNDRRGALRPVACHAIGITRLSPPRCGGLGPKVTSAGGEPRQHVADPGLSALLPACGPTHTSVMDVDRHAVGANVTSVCGKAVRRGSCRP